MVLYDNSFSSEASLGKRQAMECFFVSILLGYSFESSVFEPTLTGMVNFLFILKF